MSQIMPVIAGMLLVGCTSQVIDSFADKPVYPEPIRDKVTLVVEVVDEVYLDGVRVAEKTECRADVCMIQLERATYLDCAAHAVAHAFAYNFHDADSKTNRQFCRNWRNGY